MGQGAERSPDPAQPLAGEIEAEARRRQERMRTFQRVVSTPYPVGQTPKQTVWTLNKAKLYRYLPPAPPAERFPVPLLLVFALVNRPYIFDLRPDNSFVRFMQERGFDVYLIDWGAPGPEDQALRLDDYALDYLPRAIRKVKEVSGSDELTLLGWCIGALLGVMYAALQPADGLRNLILLTAPLDFSERSCGGFLRWVDERFLNVDAILETFGNMPAELIDYGAKALKPVDSYLSTYARLWENADNPRVVDSWHAMHTWINDGIPMAGAAFRQLIVELYRENRLLSGTLLARGRPVDLGAIRASLLNVVAERDHIVPPPQSESILARVGSSDRQLLRIPGGHIGIMAGSSAVETTWPEIERWLAARSR
ncbi:MAG TPA: alpha/beta fold hydrolase [Chloroflexota bacterium]|nr:alpha/beta fold hydrolase [Chloroflexota bacterium]